MTLQILQLTNLMFWETFKKSKRPLALFPWGRHLGHSVLSTLNCPLIGFYHFCLKSIISFSQFHCSPLLDNTRGQVARRTFCAIKKCWVFENRNLWFWNLDFQKSKFAILKFGFSKIGNFDFQKLNFSGAFVTAKNSKTGWSLSGAFARKKVSVTDRQSHTHRHTHITKFGGRLHN